MSRNVELIRPLGRLYSDYKSIAELRRIRRDAVTAAGADIRFARNFGLIRGEWIARLTARCRALVASIDSIKIAEEEQQANIDPSAVQTEPQTRTSMNPLTSVSTMFGFCQ